MQVEVESFPTTQLLQGVAPQPPAEAIEDMLIDQDINLLSAAGGEGKSTIAAAFVVATALPPSSEARLFGSKAVYRRGPVLMINPEDGTGGTRALLDATVNGLSLSPFEEATVRESVFFMDESQPIDLRYDTPRIAQTAIDCGAVLIVIDPLGHMLGGESDNQTHLGDLVHSLVRRDLCRGARLTALMTQHDKKPQFGNDDTPSKFNVRGGGSWVNGARLVFNVKRRDDRMTLTCTKSNRLKVGTRIDLNFKVETDPANKAHWLKCSLTDAKVGAFSESLTAGIGRPINDNERRALMSVDDKHEAGMLISWSRWTETAGLNTATLKSIKTRLLDAGMVKAVATGNHRNGGKLYSYGITDAGRNALESGWVKG